MTPNLVCDFIELNINTELSTKVVTKGYAAGKLKSSHKHDTQTRAAKAHRHASTRPAAIKEAHTKAVKQHTPALSSA